MYAGGAALGGILAGVFYNFHEKLFIRHDEHQHQLHHTTDSINPEHERKHSHWISSIALVQQAYLQISNSLYQSNQCILSFFQYSKI